MGPAWLGLLVMGDPPETPYQVARNEHYEICIAAFPASPHEGAAAHRRFYLRGGMGRPIMFSDAEVVTLSAFHQNPCLGKLLGYGRPEGGHHAGARLVRLRLPQP